MSTTLFHLKGWFQTNSEGLSLITLAIVDEGFITRPTDTPANKSFRPRLVMPEDFHILKRPKTWVHDNSEMQNVAAGIGDLLIDNYDGAYNFITRADLRDSPIVLKLPPAMLLGGATTYADAPTVATALLDFAQDEGETLIRVTLKDPSARLDRPLLVKYNPPYVDSSAANQMIPLLFGACRNVPAQLIDEANRLYRLHDSVLANIATTRDKGQILDVYASPPQVVPALNKSGIQLETLPEGKLLCDASSVGQQAIAPGVTDVLAGIGLIRSTTNPGVDGPGVTTWTPPSPPSGWTYSSLLFGSFTRLTASNGYDQDWSMQISTKKLYNGSETGCYAYLTTPFLNPGEHYRVSFMLDRLWRPNAEEGGGFLVRTDLTRRTTGDVSGSAYGPYLDAPSGGAFYSFAFETPEDGVTRTLYMIMVGGGASLPNFTGIWHGLSVEKLGQFNELQLEGIQLNNLWNEILYVRAYEPSTLWSASDLNALDAATGYKIGLFVKEPPNTLALALAPLNTWCATMQTDALGVMRVARLIDPTDPDGPAPVAAFDLTNTERPVVIETDPAQYLTTVMGARTNWELSGEADFVSDKIAVPEDIRKRYMRTSQYQVTSSVMPAAQYQFAINAKPLASLLDDPDQAQIEIDRVNAIFSPRTYRDGTVFNGKRHFVQFTARFDDIISLGRGTTIAAYDLRFGQIILLTYPDKGFSNSRLMVAGTDLYPFAQKIIIWGFF